MQMPARMEQRLGYRPHKDYTRNPIVWDGIPGLRHLGGDQSDKKRVYLITQLEMFPSMNHVAQ